MRVCARFEGSTNKQRFGSQLKDCVKHSATGEAYCNRKRREREEIEEDKD
jgi:hypothetical protein